LSFCIGIRREWRPHPPLALRALDFDSILFRCWILVPLCCVAVQGRLCVLALMLGGERQQAWQAQGALGLDCGGVASSSAGGDSATRSRKRQAVAPAAVLGGGARQAICSSFRKRPARAAGQQAKSAHGPKHQATTAAACSGSLAQGAGS